VNWIVPVFPLRSAFQALVTLAPDGRVAATVQPLTGDEPAVTRIVATNPSVHWLVDTDAEQPLGGGGGVVGPPVRAGVCQSRHSARFPAFLPEIQKAPGALPVFSRCFWMFCCKAVRHSGLAAQWLPSWMSDQ
jgi:hypothetical protein